MDEDGLDWDDLEHSQVELRRKRLGLSSLSNLIVIAYTVRELKNGKETIRIISARIASKKERKHIVTSKKIDFSDIPDSSDVELLRAKRVGRPSTGKAKQLIALRISPLLLSKLKKLAEKKVNLIRLIFMIHLKTLLKN